MRGVGYPELQEVGELTDQFALADAPSPPISTLSCE